MNYGLIALYFWYYDILYDPQDHLLDAPQTPSGLMPLFTLKKLLWKLTFEMVSQVDPNQVKKTYFSIFFH